MTTALIPITKKPDDPGYVYLVKFPRFKNCYKIGSSANMYSRLKTLGNNHGGVELIACGYTNNKQQTEVIMQQILHQFSNYKFTTEILKQRGSKDMDVFRVCGGDPLSCEYFIFCRFVIYEVICMFDTLCRSVCIGGKINRGEI